MLIANLAGIYTGEGFVARDGRHPRREGCGFVPGPADMRVDSARGTIVEIGANLRPADAESRIDATGLVALPGFIDSHTHALFAGDRSTEFFQRWAGATYLDIADSGGGIRSTVLETAAASDDELLVLLCERLRKVLLGGTTTVEVKSGYAHAAAGELRLLRIIKRAQDTRGLPEIVPTFLGLHAIPPEKSEAAFCEEMMGIIATIREEGLATAVDAFPEKGFFSLDSALRFAGAARENGLVVKAHADELSDLGTARAFAEIGAVSVDHLQCASPEAASCLAGVSTVATLLPATSFFLGLPYADARGLIDAGAKVALATDFNPGTAPCPDAQFINLLASSQMAMTAAEVLCAATFNAASALGLSESHGALLPGRIANLQLLRKDTGGVLRDEGSGYRFLEKLIVMQIKPEKVILRGIDGEALCRP